MLLLTGVATLLPWLVEATVRRLDGGSVPWQLAIRRLQFDSGSSARVVSGIAVAVAGAIALQTLFSGVESERTKSTRANLTRAQAVAESHGRPLGDTAARLAKVPGVRGAVGFTSYEGADGTIAVGDCAVARAAGRDRRLPRRRRVRHRPPVKGFAATRVEQRIDPAGNMRGGLFLTPAAAARQRLPGEPGSTVFLRVAPGEEAIERVRNAATAIDPAVSLFELQSTITDRHFATLRRAVLAGAAATLLLVGASLLVSLLEQVRDRRRLLAVLAAFGTRRSDARLVGALPGGGARRRSGWRWRSPPASASASCCCTSSARGSGDRLGGRRRAGRHRRRRRARRHRGQPGAALARDARRRPADGVTRPP